MLEQVDFSLPDMPKAEFKDEYRELVKKLVVLQQRARTAGVGLVVLFEGWGGAGKGSRISDLMYELDARATSVHVMPDIDEKQVRDFPGRKWGVTGFYPIMQQFWQALGERGTITFYDRGWYTAGIDYELVDGDNVEEYRKMAYGFERALADDGYIVIKLFFHISQEAQEKRLKRLMKDENTAWRVTESKLDQVKHYKKIYKLYDELLQATNFDFAPWTLVNGQDKRSANMLIARTLVDAIEGALGALPEGDAPDAGVQTAHADASDVKAPDSSRFMIMAGYPSINHDEPKPSLPEDVDYKKLLKREQERFNELELEMYRKRVPLMLMYEGWDAAGKGGNIKRVAQAIDARAYTVFPSPAPTRPELMHPFLWRYWTRLPKAGHVGIYDRSWYGRVLVERVEGYAAPDEWKRAYDEINSFEYELVQWGALLMKFWVDITPDEQLKRFEARQQDPYKTWKITEDDWRNRDKYGKYKQAVDDMFRLTSTEFAPWTVLQSNDKKYARIQALQAINEALEKRLRRS